MRGGKGRGGRESKERDDRREDKWTEEGKGEGKRKWEGTKGKGDGLSGREGMTGPRISKYGYTYWERG